MQISEFRTGCVGFQRIGLVILPIFLPARSKVASATSAMKSVFLQEVQQQDRSNFLRFSESTGIHLLLL